MASAGRGCAAPHPVVLLVPREHRLTMLLRESLATHSGRTTMIAHVSDSPACHAETLGTVQLAARIHRLRRKKVKVGAAHWGVAVPSGAGVGLGRGLQDWGGASWGRRWIERTCRTGAEWGGACWVPWAEPTRAGPSGTVGGALWVQWAGPDGQDAAGQGRSRSRAILRAEQWWVGMGQGHPLICPASPPVCVQFLWRGELLRGRPSAPPPSPAFPAASRAGAPTPGTQRPRLLVQQ